MQILSANPVSEKMLVGTGGVTKGCMVVWSSGTVVKAAAAASAGTIVGIARETALAGSMAAIDIIQNEVVTAQYTGSSKTSVVAGDWGTAFDLSDENIVNLDDTTGGHCICVGYDNNTKQIRFRLAAASRKF